jgi:hypothetical protein
MPERLGGVKAREGIRHDGVVLEDFRRINDLCERGMNLVVRACQKFDLHFDPDMTKEEMAMRLFLDHRDAFEFAWSRYLLYSSSSRLSFHEIPADRVQFGPALPDLKPTQFIEIRRGQIRLSTHPHYIACERDRLLRHADQMVRVLAERIQSGQWEWALTGGGAD